MHTNINIFQSKWTTQYLIWKCCRGQHLQGWVQYHLYGILEHYSCLLPLFCYCGCWINYNLLLRKAHKQNDFQSKWTTQYLIWKCCRGQHLLGWVQYHLYSILEHCSCLLPLFCSCGCWINYYNPLLWKVHTNNKWTTEYLFERVAEDKTFWAGCTSIHYNYTYKVLIMFSF